MANSKRNFIAGRMNKSVDERLVTNGEYIDAMNVRLGSTEGSNMGSVENSKGNSLLTAVNIGIFDSVSYPLSDSARCIGAFEDGVNESIYWFIHDSDQPSTLSGKADLIVSFNTKTQELRYHVITFSNSDDSSNTTLNFNPAYLISNINKVGDLLFFTDNYNPPRKINVNTSYAYPDGIASSDLFDAEDLLVIVKPPSYSPSVFPSSASELNTFMEDRFICFSYRYKYKNNEYSATSQFTNPIFTPDTFSLNPDTFLNEGMVNSKNSATITYNSGGSNVIAVEVLFKESASSTIKVIESISKDTLEDDKDYEYHFEDSKIFTILSTSEILRLYDNVPLLAKTQTIMGNRLMYGNYIEGYDLKRDDVKTNLDYSVSYISKSLGIDDLGSLTPTVLYPIADDYSSNGSVTAYDSDIDSLLVKGASIVMSFSITYRGFYSWDGAVDPEDTTTKTDINFTYTLLKDYNNTEELVNSVDFKNKMGTVDNIQTVADSADGVTLTDIINAAIPTELGIYSKFQSGIDNPGDPILITPSSIGFTIQVIAMGFTSNPSAPADDNTVYEMYDISDVNFYIQEVSNPSSLHSNRGYEVAIIYVDEFNRASTALTSMDNNVHIPCTASGSQNKIELTIPPSQIAPEFAKRYKFAIKPDTEGYETIFSIVYFNESLTNYTYFKLDGENIAKVEEGDRYIVKRSSVGIPNGCAYATVLDKTVEPDNFIETDVEGLIVPAGTYMKIQASDFSAIQTSGSYILPGLKSDRVQIGWAVVNYDGFGEFDDDGDYTPYNIPVGSLITIDIDVYRNESGKCDYASYKYKKTFTSSTSYDNIIEWWEGDGIGTTLIDGDIDGDITIQTTAPSGDPNEDVIQISWSEDIDYGEIKLKVFGVPSCFKRSGGSSNVNVNVQVVRSSGFIAFETLPIDSLPDVWYEGQDSYPISSEGFHESNITGDINQTATESAELSLNFANCYTFGNGVESYKIRDSIKGKAMRLGNRVTTVSEQDYKRAHRDTDITYSGVYNDETNINRLNEFNLGLLNFKPLENSFGPINKLFARETDILTLQEDKISYVLSSKSLLTDASGGGVLTSIPEVLGQQVARVEDFGISGNGESFTSYGSSKFFTDTKRGALIQLKGSGSESLNVISKLGMRSWFRDLFTSDFNTQKLGAYDPYMDEYVLSSNNIVLPDVDKSAPCGSRNTITLNDSDSTSFDVELGTSVGDVQLDINTTYSVLVSISWNGSVADSGTIDSEGSLAFNKNLTSPTKCTVTVTKTTSSESPVVEIDSSCPVSPELKVSTIVLTNNEDFGKSIHYNWSYKIGTQIIYSPIQIVNFGGGTSNVFSSAYNTYTGLQGQAPIPLSASDMSIRALKYNTDTYNISNVNNPKDKFSWLVSDTTYANTEVGLTALLDAIPGTQSNIPSGAKNSFYYNFTLGPIVGADKTLYLVWDLRRATSSFLCFDSDVENGLESVCCDCECDEVEDTEYLITNSGSTTITVGYNEGVDDVILLGNTTSEICSTSRPTFTPITAVGVSVGIINCNCE